MCNNAKDYNILKCDAYFYLDETSPSGLRWKVDRLGGKHYKSTIVSAGDTAGWLRLTKTGSPSGWYVTLNRVSLSVHRIMYVLLNGSIDIDLVIDHLDGDPSNNTQSNLVLKSRRANQQNCKMSSNNTSGVTGVTRSYIRKDSDICNDWVATWYDTGGKRRIKSFAVIKYGYNEAFALAVAYRTDQIKLLNESGQCYTERHLQTGENNE